MAGVAGAGGLVLFSLEICCPGGGSWGGAGISGAGAGISGTGVGVSVAEGRVLEVGAEAVPLSAE
jgi:hypothetical protein